MIDLLSILPHEPIEDCDNSSIFLYFLYFLWLFLRYFPLFSYLLEKLGGIFLFLFYFFNFIFILKLKKTFEFRDFAAYTEKLQSYEKIAYRRVREEKTCPNMRCYR